MGERAITGAVAFGVLIIAGIGFSGSYSALKDLGMANGFGDFSYVYPIGLDAGIVVLLALDLLQTKNKTPTPFLRLIAHLLTAGTIWFNASSAGSITAHPVAAGMHAVLPVLFVTVVEALRHRVVHAARRAAGQTRDGVPLYRWILAPFSSFAMYRRMRLRGMAAYADAVGKEKELLVYKELLDRDTPGGWRKASPDARLPMTMARYGLSVEESLALPQKAAEEATLRQERAAQEAQDAELRAKRRATDRKKEELRMQGELDAERYNVEAMTSVAAVNAKTATTEAEVVAQSRSRIAEVEARAAEQADTAEADRRQAKAEREAAEDRARALETDRAAAGTERRTAEDRRAAAEADRLAAENDRWKARAQDEAKAAVLRAAEADRAAVETRASIAEIEARAVEAEDTMKLKPTERDARRVARMALHQAGGVAENLELSIIAETLGCSVATASSRRAEAGQLLAGGYRPTGPYLAAV